MRTTSKEPEEFTCEELAGALRTLSYFEVTGGEKFAARVLKTAADKLCPMELRAFCGACAIRFEEGKCPACGMKQTA